MKKEFSIGEALKFGWETTTKNLGFLLGVIAVIVLWNIGGLVITRIQPVILMIILSVVQKAVNIVLTLGLVKISLKLSKNEAGEWADLYNCYPLFWKYLGAAILMVIAVLIGTVLLIVPGIILALQFSFFMYMIIEKNLGPINSLKESSKMTKGIKWQLFLFALVSLIINLIGTIFLGLGLLISTPVTLIAWAYVYKKLESQTEHNPNIDIPS